MGELASEARLRGYYVWQQNHPFGPYDIESIDEIENQTSRPAPSETGTQVQATSHKIKMAGGMSDKLTVAQKNRIVKNQGEPSLRPK